ncbi:hypothetical protein FB45DRAFT_25178 [Roridomyces roridus]|uniref:F-box domain-containing protein n=1 Tax=Roridomyces roridus TaxID=1738132 RepID=A0AAD7CJZ0_9AGAR|nr:hypothetical protein FB45DRAFT_25178 [Roridomyces roridus]
MATSVAASALRSRIEEISFNIKRQHEILRDLESQQSAAQSQLNSILDPMERLPLELSSEIFMQCFPDKPSFEPSEAPALFTQVSRCWTRIALSTPALWASVCDADITPYSGFYRPGEGFDELFHRWISRSKSLPLTVNLGRSLRAGRQSTSVVQQYAHRVQELSLSLQSDPGFQRTEAAYPSLKTLTLTSRESKFLNAEGCVKILRSAPNLINCSLFNFSYEDHTETWPLVTLSSLKCLTLGDASHPRHDDTSTIVQFLTLPSLETLRMSLAGVSRAWFISFLTRSSPPLRSLSLSSMHYEEGEIEECLRLVADLTDLNIRFEGNPAESLLQLFAYAKGLLPHLCSLTIRAGSAEQSDYSTVADLLESRRGALRNFRLETEDVDLETNGPLADELRKALLSHRQAGMEVHVGTEEENLF